MSVLKSKTTEQRIEWKKYIVPAYIVFSLLFIVLTVFVYFENIIYNSGFVTGQNQGYVSAFQGVIAEATKTCEPFNIQAGDENTVSLINISCLEGISGGDETNE